MRRPEDKPKGTEDVPAKDTRRGRGMRMAELAARSGIPRETIHFYLREGLLPRPEKGGRTVAYYGEEHLARLQLIRRLREEKYLPIAVIRRLLEAPAASTERDMEVLADVMHIIPAKVDGGHPFSAEAMHQAKARGLIGTSHEAIPEAGSDESAPPSSVDGPAVEAGSDPSIARILRVVEETLALDERASGLTLDDLEVCAAELSTLVRREATLFFDHVIKSGDVGGSIAALRAGRPAVAHFITAYRDLMLRRIVEEVLVGITRGSEEVVRSATVPLSTECEVSLGVADRRSAAWAAVRENATSDTAAALVWHLFGSGSAAELANLPASVATLAGRRLSPLIAWGALTTTRSAATLAGLRQAVEAAPDFALGQILLGEAIVARGMRRREGGASLLEEAIPAVHRVLMADPRTDPEPIAQAFGWFHRGRLTLALPTVLGQAKSGATALGEAIALTDRAEHLEPVVRIRIGANARLVLGRALLAIGEEDRGVRLLRDAAMLDPDGPIAELAREAAFGAQGQRHR